MAIETMNQAIIAVAKSYLGKGEEGRNNQGFWLEVIRGPDRVLGSGDWCAEFVSHCIINAYYGLGAQAPDIRSRGARKLCRNLTDERGLATQVTRPKPGDIELMRGHVGIVYKIRPGYRVLIEGNQGRFPSKVKYVRRSKNHRRHVAFFRVHTP